MLRFVGFCICRKSKGALLLGLLPHIQTQATKGHQPSLVIRLNSFFRQGQKSDGMPPYEAESLVNRRLSSRRLMSDDSASKEALSAWLVNLYMLDKSWE